MSRVQVEAGAPGSPPARAQVTVTPMAAVSGRFLLLGGPGRPLRPGELLRLQLRDVGPPPAPRIYHVLVRDTHPRTAPPPGPPSGIPILGPPAVPRDPSNPGPLPRNAPSEDPCCPQGPSHPGTPLGTPMSPGPSWDPLGTWAPL